MAELPIQTFQRLTGKQWTPETRNQAYSQYSIKLPSGSVEGNLALQKAMLASPTQTTGATPNASPGSIPGATDGAVPTPTKDIKLNIPPAIPSDIIAGAPTTGQVLGRAKSMTDQFQEFLTQRQARQAELEKAQMPTEQETQLRQQLTSLNNQARQAIFDAETRAGGTASFAGGEASRISRQATIQTQGLVDQLNALVGARQTQIDAVKSLMQFDQDTFTTLTNLQKLTKPDVLQTKVATNGDVYSTVQDADGNIQTIKTGSIPVDKEDTTLKWNEVKNSKGGTSIWAVNSAGQIVTKEIPGTAMGVGGGLGTMGGIGVESRGISAIAKDWLSQFNSGLMESGDIYAKIGISKETAPLRNEVARLIAKQGGKRIYGKDDASIQAIQSQIKNVDDLLEGNKFGKIVGFIQGGAGLLPDIWNVGKQDALAIAKNLTSNQTLQALADAKSKGITFGALSEQELGVVAESASRIAAKIKTDKDGNITGFSGSQGKFKEDLNAVKKGLEKSIAVKTQTIFSEDENAELDRAFSSSPSIYFK